MSYQELRLGLYFWSATWQRHRSFSPSHRSAVRLRSRAKRGRNGPPERMRVNVMIDCRKCQHGNVTGAVFCADCGEQLGSDNLLIPAITDERITEELRKKAPRPEPATPIYSWISLHFMGSGKILPLASRNEFILGRL